MNTSKIYNKLAPDVAENVKLIADTKQKMDDPLSEGITMADVNKMADAGAKLSVKQPGITSF